MKIKIVDGEYEHDTVGLEESQSAAMGGVVAAVGMALIDLNKTLEELFKSHSIYQYSDEIYVDGILLSWAGDPIGIVQHIDDEPAFLPTRTTRRETPEESTSE